MLLARLASRNLRRNKRRTVLTLSAVVAGVGFLVLGESFIGGLKENIIVAAEDAFVGHVTARPHGYPADGLQQPLDDLLVLTPAMRTFLDRTTVAWTTRTLFSPLASTGREAIRVRAIGYEPGRDALVFPRTGWEVQGTLPDPAKDEVAVSRGLARLLAVAPGDTLILQVRTHPGAINALEVRVSARVTTHNAALDGPVVFLPAPLAAKLVAATDPTHVALRLRSRELAAAYVPGLRQVLGAQADVVTWDDESREMVRLQDIRRRALEGVVFILLLLAGFGMANTVLIAAHERVREIGTLRSMGMTEAGVLGLFLLEGGVQGVVGSVLGLAWGGGLSAWWMAHPIDFTSYADRVSGGLSFSVLVYTHLEPATLVWALVFGVGVSIVSSIYPARVASRMAPADAVRAA
jgi:putative ABC transport system permease protein